MAQCHRAHAKRENPLRRQQPLQHRHPDPDRHQQARQGNQSREGSRRHPAITPNGKTAYTANYLDGTVTPIWTANNKAGKAIKVGKDPVVIAITP